MGAPAAWKMAANPTGDEHGGNGGLYGFQPVEIDQSEAAASVASPAQRWAGAKEAEIENGDFSDRREYDLDNMKVLRRREPQILTQEACLRKQIMEAKQGECNYGLCGR